MDEFIARFNSQPIAIKWSTIFGLSFIAWVLPISMKAPKPAIALSLSGAIFGFGYCAYLSPEWKKEERRQKKRSLLDEELENHHLALVESSQKQAMVNHYLPPAPAQVQTVDTTAQALTPQQEAAEPDETDNLLLRIQKQGGQIAIEFLTYLVEKGIEKYGDEEGWMSISKLQQNWAKNKGLDAGKFSELLALLTQLEAGQFSEDKLRWVLTIA